MIYLQEIQEKDSELFREEDSEEEEEEVGRFETGATHHMSAAKHRPTTPTTTNECGVSMERSSPSFVSSLPEPWPKRITLFPPSSSSSPAATKSATIGSKRLRSPLSRRLSEPIDFFQNAEKANSTEKELRSLSAFGHFLNSRSPAKDSSDTVPSPLSPPLHRSRSVPIDFIQDAEKTKSTEKEFRSLSAFGHFLNSPSPAKDSFDTVPPPLPPLHRSFSDPTAASKFLPPAAATPPRPPVAAEIIRSPRRSAEQSPNTKRLKRMKARLREMRQWWDEVLQEEDEGSYSQHNNSKGLEEAKTSSEEESVWVENRGGEGLVIHFKCPCNKGYEILLSGNNCYYKLM